MTGLQATQIFNLREQGMGYRSIASAVGLSRDSVRNYCKTHGMGGYGTAAAKNVAMMKDGGEICHHCGGPLTQPMTGRPRKFCCDRCRRAWHKAHPEMAKHSGESTHVLTCRRCKKTFISYRSKNRKYCSHGCYIKYRFREGEDGISKTENERSRPCRV